MTTDSIKLKSLHFDESNPDGPTRVVADFPSQILYTLARLHGALPSILFTSTAAEHSTEFYNFVTGEVANKYFDDGLNDVAPGYSVHSPENILAWYQAGSKDSSSPQQELARVLDEALSDLIGGDDEKRAERAQLAAMLSQTVVNAGWRQVTKVGRWTGRND